MPPYTQSKHKSSPHGQRQLHAAGSHALDILLSAHAFILYKVYGDAARLKVCRRQYSWHPLHKTWHVALEGALLHCTGHDNAHHNRNGPSLLTCP